MKWIAWLQLIVVIIGVARTFKRNIRINDDPNDAHLGFANPLIHFFVSHVVTEFVGLKKLLTSTSVEMFWPNVLCREANSLLSMNFLETVVFLWICASDHLMQWLHLRWFTFCFLVIASLKMSLDFIIAAKEEVVRELETPIRYQVA